MSDAHSGSSGSESKSWLEKISHFISGEPLDRDGLLDILREARDKRLIDSYSLSMIEGVLDVSESRVRDIMIPRIQMVVVPRDADLESIFPLVIESAHSRFPVIGEDRSEVVGVLLTKDILAHALRNKSVKIEDIMRPAYFIPESKRLNVLLKEFRSNRNHMAIIVDEYGMTAGLVTIEDVLEQIVGEIEDEHDMDEEAYVFRRSDDEYTVKALMPIEEFNEYFYAHLYDEEFDTLGGFIVHRMEHMPKRGEKLEIDRFRFEILRADNRRIHVLKLKVLRQPENIANKAE
ncbi:MAG: HlyC/CorC family transporter [Gammaproteobacteria bacterium]